MPQGSSAKHERPCERIKENAESLGTAKDRAKEFAARTVNRELARSGESATSSKTSTGDKTSAPQRGG